MSTCFQRLLLVIPFLFIGTDARGQLVVGPERLHISLQPGEAATQAVTLKNDGDEALTYCLNFERPLQRIGSTLQLSDGAIGSACGDYGEMLLIFDDDDFGESWLPSTLTMTPEGRLFVSENGVFYRTFEFTPDLQLVRSFEHPHVAELTSFGYTRGVTYDTKHGTLWWMNYEGRVSNGQTGEHQTLRVLLIEGDLDGVPTGRRMEIAPPDTPLDRFSPFGVVYEPATDLFYFNASNGSNVPINRKTWAFNRTGMIDRTGSVPEGYPVRPEYHPTSAWLGSLDAHGGAGGGTEGVRLEHTIFVPTPGGSPGNYYIFVTDRWGNRAEWDLETRVREYGDVPGRVASNPVRSRVDPNGVMYFLVSAFRYDGLFAVRPHPLPPTWLVVGSNHRLGGDFGTVWRGTLEPGESREVTLTFRAGAREVGSYTSALQVFDAATGEAVEVPLTLKVPEKVAESAATTLAVPPASSVGRWQLLAPYPNPSGGTVTVPLEVERVADVRVSVVDVLGREVAVLHEGPLPAGAHRLLLRERLPVGLYVVRTAGAGLTAARRLVVH